MEYEQIEYYDNPETKPQTPAYARDSGDLSSADNTIELLGRMAVPSSKWAKNKEVSSDVILGVFQDKDERIYTAYIRMLRAIQLVEEDIKRNQPNQNLEELREFYFVRFCAFVEMTRGREGKTLEALITRKTQNVSSQNVQTTQRNKWF